MSTKPKDYRPKVISFRTALDGLSIAARQSVLWPCHAFNISIPQKKKSGLNVFEETVLKITEIEYGDTEKIAAITCLEKELVAFIQNRLNQLGLLNHRYELSATGQGLLNEWYNKSDENLEYAVVTMFVDLLSGKLLPYVSTEQLSYKKLSRIGDNGFIDFLINPINEKSRVSARQIRPSKDSFWNVVPDSSDIIRAIREFKKKYKRYALLKQGVDQYPPLVPMAEAISLNENPELIYLHCEVFVQTSSDEILVTDGCGFGFSETFAKYLISQNWQWLSDLKSQAITENLDNSKERKSDRKLFKYTEISKRITQSKSNLERIKNLNIDSSYNESNYRQEIEEGIKNLYAALEWSLRQVVAENMVAEWESVFSTNNFQNNERLLIEFAKKIGFLVNEKNKSLLQVKPGAIRQIKNGKVELQPLLALAIAGANVSANHPMHHLAKNHAGFLSHIYRLKKYRDPIEHGSAEKLNIDKNTLEEFTKITTSIVTLLVPGVAEDLRNYGSSANHENINQERLKASIKLDKALGIALVSSLRSNIKEQLIRSEIMLEKFTLEKNIEIIKCYAAVLQQILIDVVKERTLLEFEGYCIRELAIDMIIRAGFFSTKNQIPKELTTVAVHNIEGAVQGLSTTLGAQSLAIFLLGEKSELTKLRELDPEFINFVSSLIRHRGHGNEQQLGVLQSDICSLRDRLFKVIKMLSEIF